MNRILPFIFLTMIFTACCKKQDITENNITFETFSANKICYINPQDTVGGGCKLDIVLVYPTAFTDNAVLNNIQQGIIGEMFGDEYFHANPQSIVDEYVKLEQENWQLTHDDFTTFDKAKRDVLLDFNVTICSELRYNKVIIATDADNDGMHIRLLLLTFFLQFFPDLVKKGHVYILQTPLFRVRNKKETRYCYTEEERLKAISELGASPEITRFKGLGEISPDEFRHFIGKDIRLDPVTLTKADSVGSLLEFYMGKNTPERQDFIIDNLVIEEDAA